MFVIFSRSLNVALPILVGDFPAGTTNVPVQSGQLIGYQGAWSGNPPWPKWVHMSFAVIDSSEQNTFPEKVTPERSEEHTSELQSPCNLVCRLILEKKK